MKIKMFDTEEIKQSVKQSGNFLTSTSYYKKDMLLWHTLVSVGGKPIKNKEKTGETPVWRIVKVEEEGDKYRVWVEEV